MSEPTQQENLSGATTEAQHVQHSPSGAEGNGQATAAEYPFAAAVPRLYQLPVLKKLDEAQQLTVYQQAETAIRADWRVRLAMLGWFAVFLAYAVGLGFAKYEGAKILFPALAWVLCWRFIRRQIVKQRMRLLAQQALNHPPSAG